MTTTHHQGLILSPFDPRYRSGIDWESLQHEANAKDQRSALAKKRSADKQFLDQPPGYKRPVSKPVKVKAIRAPRIPRDVRRQTGDFPGTFTLEPGSKMGRMRALMAERGPMTRKDLGEGVDVQGHRVAEMMRHEIKAGRVLTDKSVYPQRYYVPSNPPKVVA